MSKIEEMLADKKTELDELEVPEGLESRLNIALQNRKVSSRRNKSWKIQAAVLLIAFVLATYNMDTLEYYGRELLGFDNILNGTLKQLNKMGMGQTVEKSYTFSNGTKVTLNGIMIDDNQLLAFYTLENPNGSIDDVDFSSSYMGSALGRHYQKSGQGQTNEDNSLIKWVMEFEPPHAFEKKLTWVFDMIAGVKSEKGQISFVLDRDKAMGHTLKSKLNKSIRVDGTDIRFDTITASPTTTILKGTVQSIVELAMDQISGERLYAPHINIELLADGKKVQPQGTGTSTDMKGMTFEARYDALPREVKKLQLHLAGFRAEHEVNEQIMLDKSLRSSTSKVNGQDITIEKVEEVNGETFVTITTEESVVLSRVYLLAGGNKVQLTETIENGYDKKADGTVTKTRTLRFKTAAEDLQLDIQRMRYEKAYDEYIDIPLD